MELKSGLNGKSVFLNASAGYFKIKNAAAVFQAAAQHKIQCLSHLKSHLD